MAFSASILKRTVCGNMRWKFYRITDAATTNSVVLTDMCSIKFVASTQTTDKSDSWKAKTLKWTGTVDTNTTTPFSLKDSSGETFVEGLTGSMAWNTTDSTSPLGALLEYKDADECWTLKTPFVSDGIGGQTMTLDTFPDGNETFAIIDDHKIMLTPVSASDDGFMIVMGK